MYIDQGFYPNLYRVITAMRAANNVELTDTIWAPKQYSAPDLRRFEEQAEQLTEMGEEMIETFTDGEYDDQIEIADQHDLHPLHNFLTEVFDEF